MVNGKIGLGGFELTAVANRSTFSLTVSVRNWLWRRTHATVRALLVRKRATPTGPRSITADQLAREISPERRAILEKIKDIEWYHSLDLGHSVVTPGVFDHRRILSHYAMRYWLS